MTEYQKVLQLLRYPTLIELFRLENSELTNFVVRGIKNIIKESLNLEQLDSLGKNYGEKYKNKNSSVISIYTNYEYVKEMPDIDFKDLGKTIKFKIIEHKINVSSSKFLYIEINKEYLKQFGISFVK